MTHTPSFKNVFILSTGRCGSTGLARACAHIQNYTAGHETRCHELGAARLAYPAHHIESDNRLSWFLGRLDEAYGQDAFYVHLTRERTTTAESFNDRWHSKAGIMPAYGQGILMTGNIGGLAECKDYYDTVNSNIRLFLRDKPHQMTMQLHNMEQQFPAFWANIGAEGDLSAALSTWNQKHNRRATPVTPPLRTRVAKHIQKSRRFLKDAAYYYKIS